MKGEGTPRRRAGDQAELISIVLMSFAAIITAWFSFQASVWGGLQALRLTAATTLGKQAEEAHLEANQQMTIDIAQFVAWMRATTEKDDVLAKFLHDRFRPEMRPAVEAWSATRPQENPAAPATPFQMKEYRLAKRELGDDLAHRSTSCHQSARVANYNADRYTRTGVPLAIALFFAGLAPKLTTRTRRYLFLAISAGLTLFVFVATIGLPIARPEDPSAVRDAPIADVCGREDAP